MFLGMHMSYLPMHHPFPYNSMPPPPHLLAPHPLMRPPMVFPYPPPPAHLLPPPLPQVQMMPPHFGKFSLFHLIAFSYNRTRVSYINIQSFNKLIFVLQFVNNMKTDFFTKRKHYFTFKSGNCQYFESLRLF